MVAEIVLRSSGDPSRVQHLGPYALEPLIDPEEEARATAYRVTIAPQNRTRVSFHRVAEEFYYVIAGRGVAILNGIPRPIAAGDFIRLPPGTTHGFLTEDEPLELLDFHTPGSRPDRDVYFLDGDPPPGFARLEES